ALARAGLTDQAERLTTMQGKAHVVDRAEGMRTSGTTEADNQALRGDHGVSRGIGRSRPCVGRGGHDASSVIRGTAASSVRVYSCCGRSKMSSTGPDSTIRPLCI